CGAVSDAMARAATGFGADIATDEPVTELLFDGKRCVGAKTAHGEYRADAVVVNADFAQAMTKLVPDRFRKKWSDAKLETKRFSCSTYMMYLGIDGRYDDLAHHTIYTATDYRRNLDDIEHRHELSADPSVYVQNAGVTDDTLAPKGMSTIYVLAPVTHRSPKVDWAKEGPAFRQVVLGQLAKLGLKDLEKRIRFEKVITPAGWEHDYEVFKGATFNLAHNLGQMLHRRPRNRFEDIPGMYLVGGGTHPGSGLPVIYESARITSRLLLGDLGMDPTWLGEPGAAEPTGCAVPATGG
ncbi:MAG: phytoene desaturase family protein, partial [Fimbriiglobus sp.]